MSYIFDKKQVKVLNERLYGESQFLQHFGNAKGAEFLNAKTFQMKRILPTEISEYDESGEGFGADRNFISNEAKVYEIEKGLQTKTSIEEHTAFLDDDSIESLAAKYISQQMSKMAKKVDEKAFARVFEKAELYEGEEGDSIVETIMKATAELINRDGDDLVIFVNPMDAVKLKTSPLFNVGGTDSKDRIEDGLIGAVNGVPVYEVKGSAFEAGTALVLDRIAVFGVANFADVSILDDIQYSGKMVRLLNYTDGFVDEFYEHLVLKVDMGK